jgi:hypothetical protein
METIYLLRLVMSKCAGAAFAVMHSCFLQLACRLQEVGWWQLAPRSHAKTTMRAETLNTYETSKNNTINDTFTRLAYGKGTLSVRATLLLSLRSKATPTTNTINLPSNISGTYTCYLVARRHCVACSRCLEVLCNRQLKAAHRFGDS